MPKAKESKYASHTKADSALAAETNSVSLESSSTRPKGVSIFGRVLIFLGFPTLVGFIGLVMAYLAGREDPNRVIKFDTDFALPFVLALSMAIVIAFQTSGYTSNKAEPLAMWPKVKKRKKIIHKHVVVGETEFNKKDA
jgi:hypothetical protein